ncbi:MAG: haloacid dehalogenase type II [Pseudomonadota bacterium]|nr:haloacid dehalogenase type II [Pseudomonadota bacterium]
MKVDRREVLRSAGGLLAGVAAMSAVHGAAPGTAIRAVAFDAFPIFDPRPIQALAESLIPEHGAALMNAWRIRQFEYQWLRALAGQYVDFLQATRNALDHAAAQLQLRIPAAHREQLMAAWSELKVWPDAANEVRSLRARGLRLIFLSNMTAPPLEKGLRAAGLFDQFEAVVSTDRIRSYKPDPRAYQLGVDVLGLPKQQVLFVAFAGWDVAGARWFGYPTYWVNRQGAPPEELGVQADASGRDLSALTAYLA